MIDPAVLAAFASPESRLRAGRLLGGLMGADDSLLLVVDPVAGALLPAPGFPPTLPAMSWRHFLNRVSENPDSPMTGLLPYADSSEPVPVRAWGAADSSVLVLRNPGPVDADIELAVRMLLPLLAAAPRQELLASHLQTQAQQAVASVAQARDLARRLSETRVGLEQAYHKLRQAEANLRAEKDRLSVIFNSIRDAVIITDKSGRITGANSTARQWLRLPEDGGHGLPLSGLLELVDAVSRVPLGNPITRALAHEVDDSAYRRAVLVTPDGMERDIDSTGSLIEDERGVPRGVVLVFRDVTEKRRIEDELIKKQRLDSVGGLAGGIAHEFNNILAALVGNVGLAKEYGRGRPQLLEVLTDLERAFWRARELTQRLLTFAKGGAPVRRPVALSTLIAENVAFMLFRYADMQIQVDIAPTLPLVNLDAGQMNQALINILQNAKEAAPDRVRIEITAVLLARAHDAALPLPSSHYVRLSIRDYGPGIPAAILPHIFEPFFTTKRANGLGLATAHSIIVRHGGTLTAENAHPGTVMHVMLPALEQTNP